jgi:hypothetical protein
MLKKASIFSLVNSCTFGWSFSVPPPPGAAAPCCCALLCILPPWSKPLSLVKFCAASTDPEPDPKADPSPKTDPDPSVGPDPKTDPDPNADVVDF